MKRWASFAIIAVGLMVSWIDVTPGHADLIGLQQGNNTFLAGVYRIDTITGAQTLLGNSGFSALQDLALAPDGTYYAIAGSNTTSRLITIDPTTGAGTLVAPLTTTDAGGISFMTGLAVGSDGTLYGSGLPVGGTINNLYSINRTTGVATLIGSTNAAALSALTANIATGIMYGVNQSGDASTRGLRTVDPITGNSTYIGPQGDGPGAGVQDIAFTPDGTLWGVTQQGALYSITSSGFSLQASGLVGFRGLETLTPVPVPAAVWLFGSGLAAMAGVTKRERNHTAA
ncbi:hypothetical protein [Nitrospira lenta]|uniref:Uncharacterized protein n=1 Tax=Nitrospira lenta TaxID=1436998 RepID=A0A330KZQ2_9BACT|nr:hypothetical protein [Nitrospira lenta]SPP62950.1 exported hypothetical protein [Nitrospira lenta]